MAARRFRSSKRRTLAARALFLFAILCGLALVLARGAPEPAKQEQQRHVPVIRRALSSLEQASLAIEERNYGAASMMVRQARTELLELVPHAEKP